MIKIEDTLHPLFAFSTYVVIFFINNTSGQQYDHLSITYLMPNMTKHADYQTTFFLT